MKSMKLFSVFLMLILLFFIVHGISLFVNPLDVKDTVVDIKSGETAFQIAQKLYDKNIIRSKNWFYIYAKLSKADKDLSYGKFLFYGKMTISDVLEKIKSGKVLLKKVTIPEGLTIRKTCRLLTNNGFGDYRKFNSICNDSIFAKKVTGFSIPCLEGFLFPETYFFPEDVNEEFVISHLVKEFFRQTAGLDFIPNENLDYYETIILASIVEREAKVEEEKPIIASVYLNRIENGYKLQADPTIAYVLEKSGKSRKKIFYRDLEIISPYNTYKNYGLPPTPICSPFITSIEATLKPAETDYFFFFANFGGRHEFSQTYSQHLSKQRLLKQENGK